MFESGSESESNIHDAGIEIRIGIKVFGNTEIGIVIGITYYWNRNGRKLDFSQKPSISERSYAFPMLFKLNVYTLGNTVGHRSPQNQKTSKASISKKLVRMFQWTNSMSYFHYGISTDSEILCS